MKDLNVGIVGLGWVAGAHIETFKSVEGAQVKAICELQDALRTLGGDLSYIMKEIKNLSDCVKRIPMNKTKWETGV